MLFLIRSATSVRSLNDCSLDSDAKTLTDSIIHIVYLFPEDYTPFKDVLKSTYERVKVG